jgi:hypothetical protein
MEKERSVRVEGAWTTRPKKEWSEAESNRKSQINSLLRTTLGL